MHPANHTLSACQQHFFLRAQLFLLFFVSVWLPLTLPRKDNSKDDDESLSEQTNSRVIVAINHFCRQPSWSRVAVRMIDFAKWDSDVNCFQLASGMNAQTDFSKDDKHTHAFLQVRMEQRVAGRRLYICAWVCKQLSAGDFSFASAPLCFAFDMKRTHLNEEKKNTHSAKIWLLHFSFATAAQWSCWKWEQLPFETVPRDLVWEPSTVHIKNYWCWWVLDRT